MDRGDPDNNNYPLVSAAAWAGLSKIRHSVEAVVVLETRKLRQARHDAYTQVSNIKCRLSEENERLKFVQRKVRESTGALDRTGEGYERARLLLLRTRNEDVTSRTAEEKAYRANFLKNCEDLARSWLDYLTIAESRVNRWEFSANRQEAHVERIEAELLEAEATYAENIDNIDAEVSNMEAVSDVLKHV